jgi:hypothetical protein
MSTDDLSAANKAPLAALREIARFPAFRISQLVGYLDHRSATLTERLGRSGLGRRSEVNSPGALVAPD